MQTSRRDFFKVAAVGGVAATIFGFDLKPAYAQLKELKIARAQRVLTAPWAAAFSFTPSATRPRTSRRK
jgi:hypothetical protein